MKNGDPMALEQVNVKIPAWQNAVLHQLAKTQNKSLQEIMENLINGLLNENVEFVEAYAKAMSNFAESSNIRQRQSN
jgi:hypothetical protein